MSRFVERSATVLVDPEELGRERLEITGDAYHHLFRVRRLDRKSELRLVDGRGRARRGKVTEVDRERALIEVGVPLAPREPELWVEVFVVPPRPQRASLLVEKGTELGVSAFRFVRSRRADRDFGRGRFERLGRVARAALEQCGRARLPEITGMHDLAETSERIDELGVAWLLDRGGGEPPPVASSRQRLGLLIGPEGGFTAAEVEELVAEGALKVGLGSRVLRVETAVIAAATIALCR